MRFRILSKIIMPIFLLTACTTSQTTSHTAQANNPQTTNGLSSFNVASQSPESLLRLAKGFQQTGDYLNAIKFYGQVTVKNPKIIDAWLGVIRLLIAVKNPIGARAAINNALVHHPNDIDLAIHLAEIDIASDLPTQALQVLAPHMSGGGSEVLNLLGVASEMMGSTALARSYYSQALAKTSNVTGIMNNYALSFSFHDDHKTAISMLQQNLNSSSTRKESYEILAIIYAIDDQLDAAMTIAAGAVSKEEAMANYSFYEILPKLMPSMRARAVFTRSIPVDALNYVNQTAQTPDQRTPTITNKADLAKQLVLSGNAAPQDEQPPASRSKAKKITINTQKQRAKEPEPENFTPENISAPSVVPSESSKKEFELARDIIKSQKPVVANEVEKDKEKDIPIIITEKEVQESVEAENVEEAAFHDMPVPLVPKQDKPVQDNEIPAEAKKEIPQHVAEPKIGENIEGPKEEKTAPAIEMTEHVTELEKEIAVAKPAENENASQAEEVSTTPSGDMRSEDKPKEDAVVAAKGASIDIAEQTSDIIVDKTRDNTPVAEKVAIEEQVLGAVESEVAAATEMPVEALDAYRVQIGSFSDSIAAGVEWCRIYKRVAAAGLDAHPNIRIIGEGDNVRHRLLLGEYESYSTAEAACGDLTSQKVSCYVVKGAGLLRPLESSCNTSDIKKH